MEKNQIKPKLKLNAQMLKTLKIFGSLTVIITLVGFLFGRVINGFFLAEVSQAKAQEGNSLQAVEFEVPDGAEVEGDAVAVDLSQQNEVFVLQLGAFEAYDNVLALSGELSRLGYVFGLTHVEGRFYVFSHVVGEREQLAPVEETLTQHGLDHFVRRVDIPVNDLAWLYFLMAAQGLPFEMEPEFIESFHKDDTQVLGQFMTLSTTAFEPLAIERQKMLLDIYQWLMR